MTLPDLQDQPDHRGIAIDEVGISGLRYPLTFDDGVTTQQGIAELEMVVRLPAERRGTHMSRMVQIVNDHLGVTNPATLPTVLKIAAHRLDVDDVTITLAIPFATAVTAAASGELSWQTHDLRLAGSIASDFVQITTSVSTEVTSLCPCSKAISEYGAHNQRSRLTLAVIGTGDLPYPIDVANLVDIIRTSGSCPVFPLVKRPDERAITMAAYDKPMFVEDIVRQVSLQCRALGVAHRVEARSLESIHSHDAIARISAECAP